MTTQDIVFVWSDILSERFQFRVDIDDRGDLAGLSYTSNAPGTAVKRFSLAAINGPKGVLVITHEGHPAVYLRGKDVRPHDGGTVVMRYLYDGVIGSYREFEFEARREPAGWVLYEDCNTAQHACADGARGRRIFKRMFFEKNTAFIIGNIGIKKIKTYGK